MATRSASQSRTNASYHRRPLLSGPEIADLGLVSVARDSRRWLNKVVYERARLFRRGSDTISSGGTRMGRKKGPERAHFLVYDRAVIAAACAFHWVVHTYAPHTVDEPVWLWWGILTKAWSFFADRFGDFYLERPLSDAMAMFAAKIGHREPV
jgi:hypothetical protein